MTSRHLALPLGLRSLAQRRNRCSAASIGHRATAGAVEPRRRAACKGSRSRDAHSRTRSALWHWGRRRAVSVGRWQPRNRPSRSPLAASLLTNVDVRSCVKKDFRGYLAEIGGIGKRLVFVVALALRISAPRDGLGPGRRAIAR